MAELGIVLLCFILAIPFRAKWERTPGIDAAKGAPLSAQVHAEIEAAIVRDSNNSYDWERK